MIKNYNLSSYLSSAREESSDVKVCFCKKRLKSAALLLAELLSCFAVIGSLIPCFTFIGSQVARPIATTAGDYQKAARALFTFVIYPQVSVYLRRYESLQ